MLNYIFWKAFLSSIRSVLYFLLYLIKVWNLSLILITNFNIRWCFTYRVCLSRKFRPQKIDLNAYKYQLYILHEHQHLVPSYKRTASKQSSLLWLQSVSCRGVSHSITQGEGDTCSMSKYVTKAFSLSTGRKG